MAGTVLKLNLGCNDLKLSDGFINIDIDPRVRPDLIADCFKLPFEDETVDEIYAGHLMEHVSFNEDLLTEWKRVLKKGGKITCTVPDTEKSIKLYADGQMTRKLLNQIVFGADDREQQNHHQVYTTQILIDDMSKHFTDVFIIEDSPLVLIKVKWQTIITAKK